MINFNAAQNLLSVIGLPVQQYSNITTTGNNNFQELITGILNNQINSEAADISAAISADPNTKTALFQSISMLNLLGRVEDVSKLSTGEILNEPAVNAAVLQNNLNPEQAQLLAGGIKITAGEIVSGKIQAAMAPAAQPQGQAVNTLAVPQTGIAPAPAIIVPAPLAAAGTATDKNQIAQAVQTAMDFAAQPANITQVSQMSNGQAAAAPEINPAPVIITASTVKPVQAGSEPAAVVPAASVMTSEAITPAAAAPVYESEALPGLNTLPANTEAVSISNTQGDITVGEDSGKLVAALQDIIKDFTALIYDLKGNKNGVQDKAEQINDKVNALVNKLNEMAATAAYADTGMKAIADDAADILAVVAAVLYRITQAYANTAAGLGKKDGAAGTADILINNGNGTKSGYQENRQITVASSLNQETTDLISKIYGLLKKMNGEIYVEKKTYFVYDPASSYSSRIAKDGSLIINTAITGAGAAAPADNNTEAVLSPVIIRNPAVMPEATRIQAGTQAVLPLITAQEAVNIPVIIENMPADSPEVIAARPDIIAPARNSEKAAMLLSGIQDKNAAEIDWLKDTTARYVPGLMDTENTQLPVGVKVFQKAVDFAGRVKEDVIIRQVVQNIQNTVRLEGRTEIKMFLRPENMGPVSISLDSRNDVITGRIQVANTDVKDILKVNLPVLRDALANIGFNVTQIDVSIMSGYIGSSLPDSSSNRFAEWEGSAMRPEAEETLENAGALNGVNGYLNFLA